MNLPCLSSIWSVHPAFSRTEVKADVLYPVAAFLVLHYAAQRLPDPRPWLVAFTIAMMTLPAHA